MPLPEICRHLRAAPCSLCAVEEFAERNPGPSGVPSLKMCDRCKELKPKSEFYVKATNKDGVNKRCRGCCVQMVMGRRNGWKSITARLIAEVEEAIELMEVETLEDQIEQQRLMRLCKEGRDVVEKAGGMVPVREKENA